MRKPRHQRLGDSTRVTDVAGRAERGLRPMFMLQALGGCWGRAVRVPTVPTSKGLLERKLN